MQRVGSADTAGDSGEAGNTAATGGDTSTEKVKNDEKTVTDEPINFVKKSNPSPSDSAGSADKEVLSQQLSGSTTQQGESKEIADQLFSQVAEIVPTESQEVPSEGYQNRERQRKVKRNRGKDFWYCADPGCKKENLRSSDNCVQCGLSAKMTRDYQGRRGGGRGGRRGGSGGGGGWNRNQEDRKNKAVAIDTDDPVQNMFGQISKVLDARHDKRERIVKLSRDITIESKRIIFCLHRIKSEDDKAAVLGEAEGRLWEMKEKLWYYLARELKGEDHYQFIRAYSAGLQEWVEALSFYHYLTYDKLILFEEVEKELVFKDKKALRKLEKGNESENADKADQETEEKEVLPVEIENAAKIDDNDEVEKESLEKVVKEEVPGETLSTSISELSLAEEPIIMISVTVPQSEYILGLADLTGELMRNAINSLGSGNMDVCFTLLDILQSMAEGFSKIPRHEAPREFGQKLYTLKQSCKKVENACYAISVRGSEIPKTHLADIFTQRRDDDRMEEGPGGGEGESYYSD
eukprot:GFUD01023809.1.p1 GENE.GFUD01023809.1~~GFUD01023809.1.p1  ORF type:complete len:522 (+),score=213.96 GFUD01023809.1:52-1617(+)